MPLILTGIFFFVGIMSISTKVHLQCIIVKWRKDIWWYVVVITFINISNSPCLRHWCMRQTNNCTLFWQWLKILTANKTKTTKKHWIYRKSQFCIQFSNFLSRIIANFKYTVANIFCISRTKQIINWPKDRFSNVNNSELKARQEICQGKKVMLLWKPLNR